MDNLLNHSYIFYFAHFSGVMLLLDPVLNYGPEKVITPYYYYYSTVYTNPGITKYYEYDSVLVGTNIVQNTDVDKCDEPWDCSMVRLPYSGGTFYDMMTILDLENNYTAYTTKPEPAEIVQI